MYLESRKKAALLPGALAQNSTYKARDIGPKRRPKEYINNKYYNPKELNRAQNGVPKIETYTNANKTPISVEHC